MEHESFRRPPLHGEKYCCPGKEACHPSPVIFREHFYEKKSDPFAKSQEYLCMPWLFCLDWVDLAAWARVFIWWKVGPAGMVTHSPGQKSLEQWEHNCNLFYVYHKNLMFYKAVPSVYKSISFTPSPPNTMLKDQRNCTLTVSTLSVGWGEGG